MVPALLTDDEMPARAFIATNRARSGWTTVELPIPKSLLAGMEMCHDASDLPPDNEALRPLSPAPLAPLESTRNVWPETQHTARRAPVAYELACTVAMPREMIAELRALEAGTEQQMPVRHPQRAGLRRTGEQALSRRTHDATLEDHESVSFNESRIRPVLGLLFIVAGLALFGWFAARQWPSDLSPSVKVMISR
jgi:hypothetical protein